MKYETAGDPITGLKWTKKTLEKVAVELTSSGIVICPVTVARLLKNMGFSLRVNYKKNPLNRKNKPEDKQKREQQFRYIRNRREAFEQRGDPSISVDSKKKELVGNFKNPGTSWEKEPIKVNDHDFRSQADGIAIPYGIYDTVANTGFVCVGTTHDTSAFAADAIEKWWCTEGIKEYPQARHLLLLADSGGSNRACSNLWKYAIQQRLCNRHGLTVTVCHYPPGSSKWNPIDHRLFSEISKNWAGRPLKSYETILKFIRTTKTKTGLRVKAILLNKKYKTGVKLSKEQIDEINIRKHKTLPQWNYTLKPNKM